MQRRCPRFMKRIESDISSGRIGTRTMILPVQSNALYHERAPPHSEMIAWTLNFANLSPEALESDKVVLIWDRLCTPFKLKPPWY
mmetsp:Transcript_19661/g.34560  ORF Transcript_19661/g.34560 Transcript_19661/m.34560 type:complete len:85 (-) Transcript_19661:449-703(-)